VKSDEKEKVRREGARVRQNHPCKFLRIKVAVKGESPVGMEREDLKVGKKRKEGGEGGVEEAPTRGFTLDKRKREPRGSREVRRIRRKGLKSHLGNEKTDRGWGNEKKGA